ncbi:MAG: DeoR/GlpR transcriptional regulator [Alkalibacterium sp.]|nr:DeoR/GlpR transcriptional regulator [Alkalibacterium sp.]
MFTEDRHKKILDILNDQGSVTVNELTSLLQFSPATIRSDLNYLNEKKVLIRTHGGATVIQHAPVKPKIEENFQSRKKENHSYKVEIAEKAFNRIKNDSCIVLDASSTAYELALLINESPLRLMILTNGLNNVNLLKTNPTITTLIIGGVVKGTSNAIEGILGSTILESVNIDMAFLSAHAFSLADGLTDFNLYEVELKRKMVQEAKQVYALIDSSKLEKSSIASFASAEEIDLFITNMKEIDETVKRQYIDHGLHLI